MEPFIVSQTDLMVRQILAKVSALASTGDMASLGFASGLCTSSGSTSVKTVTIDNYVVTDGSFVAIRFLNAFETTDNYLTINNTGYGTILLNGEAIMPGRVKANTILTMYREGAKWHVVGVFHRNVAAPGGVDLGLPSGTLWAEHNVGASRPEEPGKYFSWGNITGYNYNMHIFTSDEYDASAGAALTGDIAAGDAYDMVRANMGAPWRLPTVEEVAELSQYCDSDWIEEVPGLTLAGQRLTSRLNGNSIFLPAAGYNDDGLVEYGETVMLWTKGYTDSNFANAIVADIDTHISGSSQYRYYGMPVRAVQ